MGGDVKQSLTKNAEVTVTVIFLDDNVETIKLMGRCTGAELFEMVIKKLGVFHHCYFDLAYLDSEGLHCWMDHSKPLMKLARSLNTNTLEFIFSVKYYIPHPNLLIDDLTRYLFALQIKRDFFRGMLHSNRNTSLLLAAFIVQSEMGDYNETECHSYVYLRKHRLLRSAPDSYLMRVMELHQNLTGLTKSEADFHLLDAARKVELYGVRLHPVTHINDQPYNLGVTHAGIGVFQNFSRISGFSWSRIRKLSFKRRKFVIRLNIPEQNGAADCAEYMFSTQNACKNFWKKCIEQHNFFRATLPFAAADESVGFSTFTTNTASHAKSLPILKSPANIPTMLNEMTSGQDVQGATSATEQVFRLASPVKQLARLRQRASSLRWPQSTMNKQAAHSHQSRSHSSLNFKPGWMPSDYCHPARMQLANSRLGSMNRAVVAHGARAQEEHFQLLRLSFSSLNTDGLDETSANFNTLPGLRRQGELNRTRRSVSTPLVIETSVSRPKCGSHSFVPRCFHTPTRSAFFCEHGLTLTGDSSSSTVFPQRPNLEGGSMLVKATSNTTLNSRSVHEQGDQSLQNTRKSLSSSCSLCSQGAQSPVSLAQLSPEKSTLVGEHHPPATKAKSTGDLKDDSSVLSFERSYFFIPAPSDNLNQITSPHMTLHVDTGSSSSSEHSSFMEPFEINSWEIISRLTVPVSDSDPSAASPGSLRERDMTVAPVSSSYEMELAETMKDYGSVGDQAATEAQESPSDNTQSDDRQLTAETCSDQAINNDYPLSAGGKEESLEEITENPMEETVTSVLSQVKRTSACGSVEVTSMQMSISDLCSSSSKVSSGITSHTHGMPESLADALSLGAMSMLTGVSFYASSDELHADDGEATTTSKLVHPVTSSVASFKSLQQLGRSYWGVVESSSDDSDIHPAQKRARARSAVCVGSRRATRQQMPLSVENNLRSLRKRTVKTAGRRPISPGRSRAKDSSKAPIPEITEPPIDVVSLQVFRSALDSELAYCNMLCLFKTYPVQMANTRKCTELEQWLTSHLEPALLPLIDKHTMLCQKLHLTLQLLEEMQGQFSSDAIPSNHRSLSSVGTDPRHRTTKLHQSCNVLLKARRDTATQKPPCYGQLMTENLDLIEIYNKWINDCAMLMVDLWQLGYGDLMIPILKAQDEETLRDQHSPEECSIQSKIRALWEDLETSTCFALPLLTYFLLPGRHLRQYCVTLGGLLAQYSPEHPDNAKCKFAFAQFIQASRDLYPVYRSTEQLALVLQLSRRTVPISQFLGIGESPFTPFREDTVDAGPSLLMFGWLKKFSKRGFQPRMVFLFKDRLIYCSRIRGVSGIYLKIHGLMYLRSASVTGGESMTTNPNLDVDQAGNDAPEKLSAFPKSTSFSLTVNVVDTGTQTSVDPSNCSPSVRRRKVIFLAPSEIIRDRWITDLTATINEISSEKENADSMITYDPGIVRFHDSMYAIQLRLQLAHHRLEGTMSCETKDASANESVLPQNSLIDVCWRRRLSFSFTQLLTANDSAMNGILYRRLKHASKWQKLWVILVDFRMVFYKTSQYDEAQASLTLPGYNVRLVDKPSENQVEKDKSELNIGEDTTTMELFYKTKQYWFRADSRQALMRWYHTLKGILSTNECFVSVVTQDQIKHNSVSSVHTFNRPNSMDLVRTRSSGSQIEITGPK